MVAVAASPGVRARALPLAAWVVVLGALLLVSMAAGVAIGAADLSIGTVLDSVAGRLGLGAGTDVLTTHIVVDLRLPRVLGAAAVGAGLALGGAVLQSLTGNMLADPYILGMASGASLGAVLALTTGLGMVSMLAFSAVSAAAFVGAMLSLLLVFAIATAWLAALGRLGLAAAARSIVVQSWPRVASRAASTSAATSAARAAAMAWNTAPAGSRPARLRADSAR